MNEHLPIFNRCPATLFLARHEPLWISRRNEAGETIWDWECQTCRKVVGESYYPAKPSLGLKLIRRA